MDSICKLRRASTEGKLRLLVKDSAVRRTTEHCAWKNCPAEIWRTSSCWNTSSSGSREWLGSTAEVSRRSLSVFSEGIICAQEVFAFRFCQRFKCHAMQHASPALFQAVYSEASETLNSSLVLANVQPLLSECSSTSSLSCLLLLSRLKLHCVQPAFLFLILLPVLQQPSGLSEVGHKSLFLSHSSTCA